MEGTPKKEDMQVINSAVTKRKYDVSSSKGWITVVGGFLVHLSLGTVYCFGNYNFLQ